MIFYGNQGQLTQQSEVGSHHPSVCGFPFYLNDEENPIKYEGARDVTTLSVNFLDAPGELTP